MVYNSFYLVSIISIATFDFFIPTIIYHAFSLFLKLSIARDLFHNAFQKPIGFVDLPFYMLVFCVNNFCPLITSPTFLEF